MNNQKLTASELDCVFRTTEALRDYIMGVRNNSSNKLLLRALGYIEKADKILEDVEVRNISVMYGPPEVLFSPKKLAEKRLRNEIMQQVLRTELTAEQWREIVADLVMDENCDHRLIEDLIKDNNNQ